MKKPNYAAMFTLRPDGRYQGFWHDLDKNGQPIPGYELDKSPVLTGNWIEKKIRWAEDKSAASLAGQEVILRFVMKDADLYALRFGVEE